MCIIRIVLIQDTVISIPTCGLDINGILQVSIGPIVDITPVFDNYKIKVGQVYRHYKGNEYTIIALGINESDLKPMVAYIGKDNIIWFRPLANFVELVNGQPRFTYIYG